MNILKLLINARDEISQFELNNRVVSVNVSRSASNLSKKPEVLVVLPNFTDETELVAFGNEKLAAFRVERFSAENQIPYVLYRAFLDRVNYTLIISMHAPCGVKKSQVFMEPTSTTFSALLRAK